MEKFLSVIIPAYNAQKTIKRCVKSLYESNLGVDFETIVVDDYSSDGTVSAIEKLMKEYNGIKLIKNTENLGSGKTRNIGLDAASGEFVWFVDADDQVKNLSSVDIESACEGRDAVMFKYDMVQPGVFGVKGWLEFDEKVMASRPSDEFSAQEFPEVLTTTNAVWNKWFRRQMLVDSGARFPEISLGEDLGFVTCALLSSSKIGFYDKSLYTYRMDASQLSKISDNRHMQVLESFKQCENFLKEKNVSQNIWDAYGVLKAHHMLLACKLMSGTAKENAVDFFENYLSSLNTKTFIGLANHKFLNEDIKEKMLSLRGINEKVFEKVSAGAGLFKKYLKVPALAAASFMFFAVSLISLGAVQKTSAEDFYILGGGGAYGASGSGDGGWSDGNSNIINTGGQHGGSHAGGGGGGYIGNGAIEWNGSGNDGNQTPNGAGGQGFGGGQKGENMIDNTAGCYGGKGGDAVYNIDNLYKDNIYVSAGNRGTKGNNGPEATGAGGNATLNSDNITGTLYITGGLGSTATVNVGRYGTGASVGSVNLFSTGDFSTEILNAGEIYAEEINAIASRPGGKVVLNADYMQTQLYYIDGYGGVIKSYVGVLDVDGTDTEVQIYLDGQTTGNSVFFKNINIGGGYGLRIFNGDAEEDAHFDFERFNISGPNATFDSSADTFFTSAHTIEFQTKTQDWNKRTAMLNNTSEASIIDIADNSSVKVNITGGVLDVGDSITLINGGATGTNGHIQSFYGSALIYDLSLTYNSSLNARVAGRSLNEQTKAYSEGAAAVMALLGDGSDLASTWGIANATSMTEYTYDLAVFGALSYSNARYETGSHIDVKGLSALGGIAKKFVFNPGALTAGIFVEYGSANYDSENTFEKLSDVEGTGDAGYIGGGLLGRYDFNENSLEKNYWYAEGSLRVGSANNTFETDDIGTVGHVKYDADALYYGLHLGGGRIFMLTEKINLDAYGKYFFTHQNGKDAALSTSDPLTFDGITSHRLRGGARGSYKISKIWAPYLGLAAEYELDGKVNAEIYNIPVDEVSLTGFRGIGEVGVTAEFGSFGADLGVRAFAGEKEGFDGSLRLIYFFGKKKLVKPEPVIVPEPEPVFVLTSADEGQNFFEFNSYELSENDKHLIVEVAQKYTNEQSAGQNLKKIRIEGHTDHIGTDAYNNDLSYKRAQAVAEVFIENGIATENIEVIGYGKTKMIADETEEGAIKNRRVEIYAEVEKEEKVVKKGKRK